MGLRIRYQVETVLDTAYYRELLRIIRQFAKLDTAYQILYFFGSLEILGWAVLGLIEAKKRKENGQVQIMLLALIAGPLFLRSVYTMFDTIYEELQEHIGSESLSLSVTIIYNLTTLAIYAGIVAICHHLVKQGGGTLPQGPNAHISPAYDPNFWNRPNNDGPPIDPKNGMAVSVGAPPPMYQQGGFQSGPMQQQGHGNAQYRPHPQQQQQMHQPPYQQMQQRYGNQPQYQQPYQQYQQPAQQVSPVSPQGRPVPPSDVGGSNVSATELPNPTHEHAR
ncbi:MAG: hypothetical protein Q9201_001926 [Fulgogasparrea decipioides]